MSHTPLPWASAAREGDDFDSVVYVPGTPYEVCQCFHASDRLEDREECEARTHFIVKAANSHADLVAALEAILPLLNEEEYPQSRCEVCGWPLVDDMKHGCVLGNCSYRPGDHNTEEWMRISRRRKWLQAREALRRAKEE